MATTSSGEVTLRDVLGWAQEQAKFLSPTQHHVLLYLTMNAFLTADNPEDALPGQVYSGRATTAKICLYTGLAERTVRDALRALQDPHGYILSDLKPGVGKSKINVFWSEEMDDLRAEVRAGGRRLPRPFKRDKPTPKTTGNQVKDAVILDFPFRQQTPE